MTAPLQPNPKRKNPKTWDGYDDDEGELLPDENFNGFNDSPSEPEWIPKNEFGETPIGGPSLSLRAHGEAHGPPRKRLYRKTSPIDAPGYPQRQLLKLAEYRIKKQTERNPAERMAGIQSIQTIGCSVIGWT